MSNAVFASLIENLEHIKLNFAPTTEIFKKDRDSTGDVKEVTVQEFVQAYLTSNFRTTKGHIYSQNSVSNSIDCVVLGPNHPKLITYKREVILAEGVYAAIEIKPDIYDKREFKRGLEQVRSVKLLEREVEDTDFPSLGLPQKADFQKKIPCVIFTAKSLTPKNTVDFLEECLKSGDFTIENLPDLIVTLDNGLFVITPDMKYMTFRDLVLSTNAQLETHEVFHFSNDDVATTLALFLIHLLCFPTQYLLSDESILLKYLLKIEDLSFTAYKFEI